MSTVRVTVVRALPGEAQIRPLELPLGACVADALAASGLLTAGAAPAVGLFGRRVEPDRILAEGDQVELYRPLSSAPGERRRARARAKAKQGPG
jgi:hypothetical protein